MGHRLTIITSSHSLLILSINTLSKLSHECFQIIPMARMSSDLHRMTQALLFVWEFGVVTPNEWCSCSLEIHSNVILTLSIGFH